MTRLIVENVHRMSSRPWIFVTGRLEGDALRIGDELTLMGAYDSAASVVVRSIELHGAPTKTTLAVEGASAGTIVEGAVLTRV
jgi:translation elongation factor EF-Tu-like GTPase